MGSDNLRDRLIEAVTDALDRAWGKPGRYLDPEQEPQIVVDAVLPLIRTELDRAHRDGWDEAYVPGGEL